MKDRAIPMDLSHPARKFRRSQIAALFLPPEPPK